VTLESLPAVNSLVGVSEYSYLVTSLPLVNSRTSLFLLTSEEQYEKKGSSIVAVATAVVASSQIVSVASVNSTTGLEAESLPTVNSIFPVAGIGSLAEEDREGSAYEGTSSSFSSCERK
jgi:hypothetical protein